MGRLVRMPKQVTSTELQPARLTDGALHSGETQAQNTQAADNFLERIAKYVPAEVIAFFIFINAILDQAVKTGGPGATMAGFPVMYVALATLVGAIVLTPLFVWYVREEGDAWIINACVSTVAFPFWAYALGAIAFADYRDGNLAAILLATFTVVSGFIAPPAAWPKQEEKQISKDGPRLVERSPAMERGDRSAVLDDIRAVPFNRA
jgi:hypothetical protein